MTASAFLRWARLALLAGVLVGGFYIASRFTLITLPETGCSPVSRFAAGDRLLVDSRPRPLEVGDAVLVRDADGTLQLTLVEVIRPEDGALWCGGNHSDCPGFESETVGWIDPAAVAGRILVGLSL